MAPTRKAKEHVISHYVRPARQRGERRVEVRVGNVLKELGWTNRTPTVFSTLGSRSFQKEAGLELIEKRGGPASGGPSTTWTFVYRILDNGSEAPDRGERVIPNGAGLMALAGICADTFRRLGGGEEFLKAERDWGPDAWERHAAEPPKPNSDEKPR